MIAFMYMSQLIQIAIRFIPIFSAFEPLYLYSLGEQGKGWKNGELKIQQQTTPFRLRFSAVRGRDIRGDIAIDDITVSPCGLPDNPVTAGPDTTTATGWFIII